MWQALGMIVASLLPVLFGGSAADRSTTQKTVTPPWTPKDPGYAMLSPAMLNLFTQNAKRYGNFGWAKGQGLDTGFLDSILDSLNKSKTSLFQSYQA